MPYFCIHFTAKRDANIAFSRNLGGADFENVLQPIHGGLLVGAVYERISSESSFLQKRYTIALIHPELAESILTEESD